MYLQKTSFVRTCVKCNKSLDIREEYMWCKPEPFLANSVAYGSKYAIAKLKLAWLYLKMDDPCVFCGSKNLYRFKDVWVDNNTLYTVPKQNCAFVQIKVNKPSGEVSLGPLNAGAKATKYIVKSFYDMAIKTVQNIDERFFIASSKGEFVCKLYNDPDAGYVTSLNDIDSEGFSKSELLQYLSKGRDYYIEKAGIA